MGKQVRLPVSTAKRRDLRTSQAPAWPTAGCCCADLLR